MSPVAVAAGQPGPRAAGDDAHCPRCGAGFHCGMNDAGPCPCSTVALDATTQAAMHLRYTGCLCVACLGALAAGAPA